MKLALASLFALAGHPWLSLPAAAGARASMGSQDPGAARSVVRGRLLDWRGAPARNADVGASRVVRWSSGSSSRGTGFSTDGEGRFEWELPSEPDARGAFWLEIHYLSADEACEPDADERLQLATIPLDALIGRGVSDVGDVQLELPAWRRLRELPPLTDDELEALFKGVLAASGPYCAGFSQRGFEACLGEMALRGGPRWTAFLEALAERWTPEPDARSQDAPMRCAGEELVWIALRRAQRRPDPLQLVLETEGPFEAVFPMLPVVELALIRPKGEKADPRLTHGGSYRSGRFERCRVEARQGGRRAPLRLWPAGLAGGMASIAPVSLLGRVSLRVPLRDYVARDTPGPLQLRIQYHDEDDIASLEDVSDRILISSPPFELRWTVRVLQRAEVEAIDIRAALERIDADEPVVITSVLFEPGRTYGRKTPVGEEAVLRAGWSALPGLLEALEDPELAPRRCAWVLGLLYDLTGCVDPRRDESALGSYVVVPGFYAEGRDFPWLGAEGAGGRVEGGVDLGAQRRLVERWRALSELVRVEG